MHAERGEPTNDGHGAPGHHAQRGVPEVQADLRQKRGKRVEHDEGGHASRMRKRVTHRQRATERLTEQDDRLPPGATVSMTVFRSATSVAMSVAESRSP